MTSTSPQNPSANGATRYFSRLAVDGNTELRASGLAREFFSPRLRGLLRHVDDASRGACEASPRLLVLRRPWAGQECSEPLPGSTSRLRFEALPVSRAWRTGKPGARVYHLEVPGCFHLIYQERHSSLSVQLAASMLWQVGYRAAASWAIRVLHFECFHGTAVLGGRLLQLDSRRPLETAAQAGWSVRRAEVCSDLENYPRDLDARHLGFKGKPALFGVDVESGTCETLALGGTGSAVRLRVYDKAAECEATGGLWKYAERWAELGWQDGDEVTRVELVIQDGGLVVEDGETEATAFDLRDPAALADPEQLARAWRYHTWKKRRIIEDRTRDENATMHPAWVTVQDAAELAQDWSPLGYRQRRKAQARACDTMAERDSAVAINAALRYAARELGYDTAEAWALDDQGDEQTNLDGEPIRDEVAQAANVVSIATEAFAVMLARLGVQYLAGKSDYLATYHEAKAVELGEEMAARAAAYRDQKQSPAD